MYTVIFSVLSTFSPPDIWCCMLLFPKEKKMLFGSIWRVLSADNTDVQYTEFGSTGGAGDSAGQPGLWPLLVLTAGKPSTQTGETPHGSAETLLAL